MRRLIVICTLAAALGLPAGAGAAPGDLDGSFSDDGLVRTPADGRDAALAPDGSLAVLILNFNDQFNVISVLPNGEVDPTFGGSGFGAPFHVFYGYGTAIDVGADGTIVAGGGNAPSGMSGDFLLGRLGPDGNPACPASPPCPIVTDFDGRDDRLHDVFAEPSGKTLAAGVSRAPAPAGNRLAVARYLPSGEPDSSFAGDGELLLDSGGVSTFAESAAVAGLPDGSVLLAGAGPGPDGTGAGEALLAKLEPDGDLDTGFGGGDGFLTIDLAARDDVQSIELGAEGSVFLGIEACAFGLHTSCRAAVAKVTGEGALDPAFGAGGIVDDAAGTAISATSGGGVFAAGGTPLRKYFQSDYSLASYGSDGAPVPAFGGDGLATADFDLKQDSAFAAEVAPSGNVVVAGDSGSGFGIARFTLQDGPPDMDADGRLDDADRCPERYAQNKAGCPPVSRKLKLKTPGPRLTAKLKSEIDLCRNRQRLKVVRLRRGPDQVIAKPRTNGGGSWRSKTLEPGRYRVQAPAKVAAPIARCSSLRERPVRLG